MQDQLNKILEEAKSQLEKAQDRATTEEIRVKFLGKKGELTQILRGMGKLSPEERKETGQKANSVRAQIEEMLEGKFEEVKAAAKSAQFKAEKIDVTEPGDRPKLGVKHPLTITMEEISKVFMNMGFSIVEGPEVETVFNNFDALNAAPDHPARDMTEYHGRRASENADVTGPDQDAPEAEASDQGHITGQMFPLRHSGCDPFADVPSDRRTGRG